MRVTRDALYDLNMRCWLIAVIVLLSGCTTTRPPDKAATRADDRQYVRQELGGEVSLKADREELKDLRGEIPEERQRANDELALTLELFKDGRIPPVEIRDKFSAIVEKKRSRFRAKVARLRENYHVAEVRRREDFTQEQSNAREAYLKRRREPRDSQRFMRDQDRDRTRFFADERDRRQNFETEVNSASKDFESYMREKNN